MSKKRGYPETDRTEVSQGPEEAMPDEMDEEAPGEADGAPETPDGGGETLNDLEAADVETPDDPEAADEADDTQEDAEEEAPDEAEEEAPESAEAAPEPRRESKAHGEARRYSRDISPFLLSQVKNENTRDFIENRLIPQMKWYSSKSAEYKKRYQLCMTAAITLGALIPVVSVLANGSTFIKVLIALLGAGVTAVNAYLSMQNYKDLWLTYRNTRENLLRILYCYFNNAGMFSGAMPELEKDILLVNLCEEELSRENGGWITLVQGPDNNLMKGELFRGNAL